MIPRALTAGDKGVERIDNNNKKFKTYRDKDGAVNINALANIKGDDGGV